MNISQTLHNVGLKATLPRRAVLTIFYEANHPMNAQEIYEKTRKVCNSSLATIYRTLLAFEESLLIEKCKASDGMSEYYLAGAKHPHFLRCQSCNERVELTKCPIPKYKQVVEKETGYTVVGHTLELVGICPTCEKSLPHCCDRL